MTLNTLFISLLLLGLTINNSHAMDSHNTGTTPDNTITYTDKTTIGWEHFLDAHPELAKRLHGQYYLCPDSRKSYQLCMDATYSTNEPTSSIPSKAFDNGMQTDINGKSFHYLLYLRPLEVSNHTETTIVKYTKDGTYNIQKKHLEVLNYMLYLQKNPLFDKPTPQKQTLRSRLFSRTQQTPAVPQIKEVQQVEKYAKANNAVFCGNIPAIILGTTDVSHCDKLAQHMIASYAHVRFNNDNSAGLQDMMAS